MFCLTQILCSSRDTTCTFLLYKYFMFLYDKITDVDRKRHGTQHPQAGSVARLLAGLLRAAGAARRRRKGQT